MILGDLYLNSTKNGDVIETFSTKNQDGNQYGLKYLHRIRLQFVQTVGLLCTINIT